MIAVCNPDHQGKFENDGTNDYTASTVDDQRAIASYPSKEAGCGFGIESFDRRPLSYGVGVGDSSTSSTMRLSSFPRTAGWAPTGNAVQHSRRQRGGCLETLLGVQSLGVLLLAHLLDNTSCRGATFPCGYTRSVCQAKRPNPTIFLFFVGLWAGLSFPPTPSLPQHHAIRNAVSPSLSCSLSACLATHHVWRCGHLGYHSLCLVDGHKSLHLEASRTARL